MPLGDLSIFGAFQNARAQAMREDAQQQAGQMGQLQQAGMLQGILAKQQEAQEMQQLKGVLSQSGGDPAKAVQALMASGSPKAIALAAQLKGMLPKPAEPFSLTPGSQRYGADGKLVAEAPMREVKPQNPSNVARLIAEMQALPPDSPQREAYRNAIRKETETPKQISPTIHMPRAAEPPVAVKRKDGLGNEFVSREQSLGREPAVKETADRVIPANIAKAYQENSTALRKIDSALDEVDKYPDAFGLQNLRGDAISQRVDPKGVTARAIVADIGSLKIHDRSGAAVTAAETPRLLPFIPSANDRPEAIKKKLALFRKEYESIQNDIGSMYSAEQGYKDLPSAQTRSSDKTRIKFDAQGNPVRD